MKRAVFMLQRSMTGGFARGSLLESESAFVGKADMMENECIH